MQGVRGEKRAECSCSDAWVLRPMSDLDMAFFPIGSSSARVMTAVANNVVLLLVLWLDGAPNSR